MLATIKTDIPRLVVVGMKQADAETLFKSKSIKVKRVGGNADDDIIVSQEPSTTIDIINSGEVSINGITNEDVLKIELYTDVAPETVQYFKIVGGMLDKPLGSFDVSFKDKKTGMTVFRHKSTFKRALLPENRPESQVSAYEIGVTNMSRQNAGMVGIRNRDDTTYGPTGEKFEAINLVGKVIGGFESLEKATKNGKVYMRIVNESSSG